MKRLFILLLLLCSCGYSPTSPSVPPVVHFDSFEELISSLKTPGHTAMWLRDFTVYSDPYTGFNCPNDNDLAWELANALWENYYEGKSTGKC